MDKLAIRERRRIIVSGKVQGVAFMLWVRNVANSLELVGSVSNRADGSCEVIVQGERSLIKQFAVAMKRGPAEARVDGIEQEYQPLDPKLATFVVTR